MVYFALKRCTRFIGCILTALKFHFFFTSVRTTHVQIIWIARWEGQGRIKGGATGAIALGPP